MDNPSLTTADEISSSVSIESGTADVEPSAAILTEDGVLTKTYKGSSTPPYLDRAGHDDFDTNVTSSNNGPVTSIVVASDSEPDLPGSKQAPNGTVECTERHRPTSQGTVSNLAPATPMEAEDILCLLGRCGRYQALVFLLISFVTMRGVWHLFAPIFLGADPGHHCLIPENYTFSPENGVNNNTIETESCRMPVPGGGNQTQPCQFGWEYGDGFKSYLTEVDVTLHILCLLGRCGRYQALVFLLISFVTMRGVWHLFAPIFLGADPGNHCLIPENYTFSPENGVNNNTIETESCRMPVPGGGNQTQPCQFGWEYGDGFKSYLTEWNLVCERAFMADLSSSVFMAGMIVGSLFLCPLADKFGKKTILLASLWSQGILGVGAAFVYNDIVFIVMRFFLGALNQNNVTGSVGLLGVFGKFVLVKQHQTIGLVAYVMVPEAFPSSSRTVPYFALFLSWALGIMVLALLGYLLRDWRHLELAISIPNFITVIYYWFLPESLPWLMAKQQYKRAEAVIRKAARLNRVLLPPEVLNLSTSYSTGVLIIPKDSDMKSDGKSSEKQNGVPNHNGSLTTVNGTNQTGQDKTNINAPVLTKCKNIPESEFGEKESKAPSDVITSPRNYTVMDLFRTPRIRLYTCIAFYLSLVNSLSYFGISFSVPILHGDMFLNLFISGLVEVPAHLICMATMECLGRRRPVCAFMLVCGCASIIGIFIPEQTETGSDLTWLKTTLAMVGKFGITGSYVAVYLFCVEIYPTVVRNLGLGIAAAFETAGAVAAPFIASSAKAIPRLALTIFGVLTIIGGILCLVLPETHRKPLPETIEEVEGWGRKPGVKDQGGQL